MRIKLKYGQRQRHLFIPEKAGVSLLSPSTLPVVENLDEVFEKAMERVRHHGIGTVNAISGYDSGKEIEVLYHFIHQGIALTVKTRVSRKDSAVPSVVSLFPSAMLFEQENHEFLGIDFRGNQSLGPVLLARDSPKCPLAKGSPVPPGSGSLAKKQKRSDTHE